MTLLELITPSDLKGWLGFGLCAVLLILGVILIRRERKASREWWRNEGSEKEHLRHMTFAHRKSLESQNRNY